MDPLIVKLIIAALASNGLFAFIQFLLTRKDNKNDKYEQLNDKIEKGLEEREAAGAARYKEHQESIEMLSQAIVQLTENDTEMKEYLHYIGDELTGLAHDTLVRLTDKYQRRGGITLKEKATLEAIYIPYHDGLHGNGDGKTGYTYAMELPVMSEEEARKKDNQIKYNEMKNAEKLDKKRE